MGNEDAQFLPFHYVRSVLCYSEQVRSEVNQELLLFTLGIVGSLEESLMFLWPVVGAGNYHLKGNLYIKTRDDWITD